MHHFLDCINNEIDDRAVEHVVYVSHALEAHLGINKTNCSLCIWCNKIYPNNKNFKSPSLAYLTKY